MSAPVKIRGRRWRDNVEFAIVLLGVAAIGWTLWSLHGESNKLKVQSGKLSAQQVQRVGDQRSGCRANSLIHAAQANLEWFYALTEKELAPPVLSSDGHGAQIVAIFDRRATADRHAALSNLTRVDIDDVDALKYGSLRTQARRTDFSCARAYPERTA